MQTARLTPKGFAAMPVKSFAPVRRADGTFAAHRTRTRPPAATSSGTGLYIAIFLLLAGSLTFLLLRVVFPRATRVACGPGMHEVAGACVHCDASAAHCGAGVCGQHASGLSHCVQCETDDHCTNALHASGVAQDGTCLKSTRGGTCTHACTSNTDCANALYLQGLDACDGGVCVECSASVPCASGSCKNGVCIQCGEDGLTCSPGERCIDHRCSGTCTSDASCPGGLVCVPGHHLPADPGASACRACDPASGHGCSDPFFPHCMNGTKCVQCVSDQQCGDGMACVHNACITVAPETPRLALQVPGQKVEGKGGENQAAYLGVKNGAAFLSHAPQPWVVLKDPTRSDYYALIVQEDGTWYAMEPCCGLGPRPVQSGETGCVCNMLGSDTYHETGGTPLVPFSTVAALTYSWCFALDPAAGESLADLQPVAPASGDLVVFQEAGGLRLAATPFSGTLGYGKVPFTWSATLL